MIKNKVLFFLLILVIYITHNWINFYYYAGNNVDFSKYYDFINYFSGFDVEIDYGQGALYYYLISIALKRNLSNLNFGNAESILSSSVHEVNLILYILGLLGLYSLLLLYKYDKKTIYLTLIILNFFPQSIYIRSVMKPEVFSFFLFIWSVYFVEKFLISKNLVDLVKSVPFFVLLVNTKASLAAMAVIYFLFFYSKVITQIKKKNLILIFVFIIFLISLIQFENYSLTGLTPFERVYEEEYDNTANPSIIFRMNILEVLKNPFFKYDYQEQFYSIHAKSVINLTLLDTFGDHFNQLFDFSGNYFSKERKNIFVESSNSFINNNREVRYSGIFSFFVINKLDHIRKIISVILSLFFYFGIFYSSIKLKSQRKFFLAPIIGILVLYINSLGFPSNNFNPYKGDTFKAFYYSYLLIISFSFFVSYFIKNNKKIINYFVLPLFVTTVIFIGGHPKQNSQQMSERIIATNEYSLFCEVNNFLIFENSILKKIHPSGNIEGYKSDCKEYSSSKIIFENTFDDYLSINKPYCFTNDELNVNVSNSNMCRVFWLLESKKINDGKNKIPIIALLYFLTSITLVFTKFKKPMFKGKKE